MNKQNVVIFDYETGKILKVVVDYSQLDDIDEILTSQYGLNKGTYYYMITQDLEIHDIDEV